MSCSAVNSENTGNNRNFDLLGWRAKFHPNDQILLGKLLQICHTIRICTKTKPTAEADDQYPPPLLREQGRREDGKFGDYFVSWAGSIPLCSI